MLKCTDWKLEKKTITNLNIFSFRDYSRVFPTQLTQQKLRKHILFELKFNNNCNKKKLSDPICCARIKFLLIEYFLPLIFLIEK